MNNTLILCTTELRPDKSARPWFAKSIWGIIACSTALLPNFYAWKLYYYDVSQSQIIFTAWLFWGILKYVALLVAIGALANRHTNHPILLFALAFFLLVFVSGTFVSNVETASDALDQAIRFLAAGLYCVAIADSNIEREDRAAVIKALYRFALAIASVTIVFNLMYPAGFGDFFGVPDPFGGIRHTNFLGIHEDATGYGLLLFALTISRSGSSDKPIFSLLLGTLVAACLMFASGSAAARSISVVTLICGLFYAIRVKLAPEAPVRILRVNIIVLFLLISMASCFLPVVMAQEWFGSLVNNVFGRSSDMSGRLYLYNAALATIAQHPLVGVGYGALEYQEIFVMYGGQAVSQPHNSVLQILMEGGLIGYSLFAAMVFHTQAKIRKSMNSRQMQLLIIVYALFLIASLVYCDLLTGRFFMVVGLLFVCDAESINKASIRKRGASACH